MHTTRLLASVWVVILGSACSPTPAEKRGEVQAPVLEGSVSGPEEDFVVRIYTKTAAGALVLCNGSLVAPNLVVSSRMCLLDTQPSAFTCDDKGAVSGLTTDSTQLVDPSSISIRAGSGTPQPEVAKGARIFTAAVASVCLNDIAVVQLDRAVTTLPIVPMRLHGSVATGESIRVLGYGLHSINLPIGTRYGRSDVRVAKVGRSDFQPDGGGTPPSTFTVEGSVMCTGDGGGPALSVNGALVGVLSTINLDCTLPNALDTFTLLGSFANEVILPAFAAAGFEPSLEVASSPVDAGNAGTGGAQSTLNGIGGASSLNEATGGSTGSNGSPNGTGGGTSEPAKNDERVVGGCSTARGNSSYHWLALLGALFIVASRRANGR